METKNKKILTNRFTQGMHKDSLPSLQPESTYREAWNAVLETDDEQAFGLSNENSNELKVQIDGIVRGLIFAEERDQYVVFVENKNREAELGIVDIQKNLYTVLKTGGDLEINCEEWVDMELKVMQPCNQLHLYYSSNDFYKTINLDDPCCKFEVQPLIKCDCIPIIETQIYKNGGRLPNGTYWFVAKLVDADGNETNWFKISKSVHISGGDHKPGELSKKAIHLSLNGLNPDYNLVHLGVISTIDGITAVEHVDTISYGESKVDYLYTGRTGREQPLSIAVIRGRSSRYIRGKNLMQYDGRLVLYNIRSENNIDYQRTANKIKTKYQHFVVPARYADQFKGLRPNENYWFGIRWNFCDGTSSTDFDIIGREATDQDLEIVKHKKEGSDFCPTCDLPAWRVRDTSKRDNLYLFDVINNGGYNDDIELVDYFDQEDVPLTMDEKDSIDELNESDMPDYKTMFLDPLDDIKGDLGKTLDCMCALLVSLPDIFCNPTCGEPEWDLSGVLNLNQLICMCNSETIGSGPPGGLIDMNIINNMPSNVQESIAALQNAELNTCQLGNCAGGSSCSASGGCGGSSSTCGSEGCDGLCIDGVCQSCGSACNGGGCCGASCTRIIETDPTEGFYPIGEGRFGERHLDYAIKTIELYIDDIKKEVEKFNHLDGDGCIRIKSDDQCFSEGRKLQNSDGLCFECQNGKWTQIINKGILGVNNSYTRSKNTSTEAALASGGPSDDFYFEEILDEDGCEVIGVKPALYSDGDFGYWQTKETYPFTKDCNCENIYGDLAGKPVRLHRVPSVAKEPYFLSKKGGVPNQYDIGNMEDKDSFVFLTGVSFSGIEPPTNLPKPLCDQNPFTIVYVQRTEANKSVIGSGVAISCFKGEIQGEAFMFPKHGVNSWERYDRSIEPQGPSTFRGGIGIRDNDRFDVYDGQHPVAPYIIHSFDFHANKPPLDASNVLFELELYGKGFRHGLYAEDEQPTTPYTARHNQKGTRQSLILNHFRNVRGSQQKNYIFRCVNAMSEAPADSIVAKDDEFKYPLCNRWREESVYTELIGEHTKFVEGDKQGMGDKYGGKRTIHDPDTNVTSLTGGDEASDRSFTGDILCHQMPIHDVRAHYVTFTKYLPYQYGSPISQTFIPLGLEGTQLDLIKGKISGLAGDSFVGATSFKRTSFVSDKSGRKIAPQLFGAPIPIKNAMVAAMFGKLIDYVFKSIGVRDGGYIPVSCDWHDFVNRFGGLRDQGGSINVEPPNGPGQYKGEFKDGELPLPAPQAERVLSDISDRNAGDNYWPHLLKSNVWLWQNSDANPAYRQLGDEDNNETYWPKLKKLKLDSSMPEKYDWRKTYLNRFYVNWEANPKWKAILAAVLLFLFVWGLGIYMIVSGFGMMTTALQAAGGGTYILQTIGAVLAAVVGLIVIIVGWFWMFYWAKSDVDNKFFESFVKLKNTKVDIRNPREPDGDALGPPTYSVADGKILQFEDNYWKYNRDLSLQNTFEYGYGQSNVYNTCYCPLERSTKVPYSNKQNIASTIDAWKNFRLNNIVDVAPDNGKISKIFKLGNKVYVHTTDMLLDLQTGERTANLDRGKILLGTGDLFGTPMPIYGGVVEGYAGLKDPNAAHVTNWSYIFGDRESKEIFFFAGDKAEPISDKGVRGFLHQNMGFHILEKFPDFKNVDQKHPNGIGYAVGVDHQHDRLLFTKIDYDVQDGVDIEYRNGQFFAGKKAVSFSDEEYFCNKSFTLSYYPKRKVWCSFHSYTPMLYAWDRFNMFSFTTKGLWQHNVKGSYQLFYDDKFPFMIEFPVRTGDDAFAYDSTKLHTEAYKWKGYDFVRNSKITFDKMIAFNSYQNTGELLLVDQNAKNEANIIKRSMTVSGKVKMDYSHRAWIFSGLQDLYLEPDELMFEQSCSVGPSILKKELIGKSSSSSNQIKDNFLSYRFTFNSHDDIKLFMKRLDTRVDIDQDFV